VTATIAPERMAVVSGRVLTPSGAALPGVRVAFAGHPELGFTTSRSDGHYDLACNGGRVLAVTFSLAGSLSAQRSVYTHWERFELVDDVVLTPYDPVVTPVALAAGSPLQVARSKRRHGRLGPAPAQHRLSAKRHGAARLAERGDAVDLRVVVAP